MGIPPEKIDALLPNKQQQARPLDPLTENQNAIVGKPVVAGEYQDHDAHIAAHAPIAQNSPALQAHINEHLALKMRVQVQQVIGQQLPPPGTPLPPEIENQIAVAVAQAMQQLAPQYKQQDQQPDPFVQVEMAKIEQKANADMQDTAVANRKIEMEYRSEAEDRRSREKIAEMKAIAEAQRNLGGFQ